MGITSCGPRCDVCGLLILSIDEDERVNEFSVKGIEQTLICDNKCKAAVETAMTAKDWQLLPSGPLRKVFEDAAARTS
jgi:hypothetical protein